MKAWLTLVFLGISFVSQACMPPPQAQGVKIMLKDGATKEPLRDHKVVLKMIVYNHCAEPCKHGSENWEGVTDQDGNLLVPWRVARSKPEVQIEGYSPIVLKNLNVRKNGIQLELLPSSQDKLQTGVE